jgi:hypothetical protein
MGKVLALALIGIAVLAGCGDASPRWSSSNTTATQTNQPESVAYGWTRPVTLKAFADAQDKLGSAHDMMDGHSLRAIVTDTTVRVRGDDKACSTCHEWAKTVSRMAFCERVPAFLAQPTSKGDGHDDVSAKPLVLKDLLDRWHAAGCPD